MSINIVDRCIFVNIAITSENKNEVGGLKTLFFEHSMNSHSKKAFLNLIVLARIAPYMEKKKTVMKAFATLQIGNCPFVWISHNKFLITSKR